MSATNGKIHATMPLYVEKYTDDQRAAMAHAFDDRKIRPAQLVVDMAGRGELEYQGERLPPFQTNAESVRHYARLMRKRRAGQVRSDLAALPPRDAIEALRVRLINVADAMLADLERQVKRTPGKADPERHRQISRAVFEAARIPGPTDPRPPSKDTHDPHTGKTGPDTRGGLAGSLLKAHRSNGTAPAAHDAPPSTTPLDTTHEHGDSAATERSTATQHHSNDTDDDSPGSWAREQVERLAGPA